MSSVLDDLSDDARRVYAALQDDFGPFGTPEDRISVVMGEQQLAAALRELKDAGLVRPRWCLVKERGQ